MFSYITILYQIAYRKKNPMKMYIYNVPVDRHFFFRQEFQDTIKLFEKLS